MRYRGAYALDLKRPIFEGYAAILRTKPDLKLPFIKMPDKPAKLAELYYPLQSKDENGPVISREFAAVKDADDALAFANKFGLLGFDGVPRYRGHRDELDLNGENVMDWLSESSQLRWAYEILDLVQRDELKELRALIVLNEGGVPILFRGKPYWKWDQSSVLRLKRDDILRLAKAFIADTFNRKMTGMASPMLLIDGEGVLRSYNSPSSLLGGLWLQFAEFVSGTSKQKMCESCGDWMDVSKNRSHKRKHDRCVWRERTARYRAKQK
jgi:hypothetical protein